MLVDAGLCMWMQEKTKRIKLVYPSWFMQWVIWWDHAVRCYSAYGAVNPHWNNQSFGVGLRKMRGCSRLIGLQGDASRTMPFVTAYKIPPQYGATSGIRKF